MRIVLKREKLAYVIIEPLLESPAVDAYESVQRAYQKCLVDNAREVLTIHTSMSLEFQKQYKTVDAYSIACHLREHYNEQASIERFKVYKLLFGSKMEVRVMLYASKMYKHIKRLDELGYWIDLELGIDLILARLPDSFTQFVLDYGMDHIISTLPDLIDVLKKVEGKMVKKKGKKTILKETCFYFGQVGH